MVGLAVTLGVKALAAEDLQATAGACSDIEGFDTADETRYPRSIRLNNISNSLKSWLCSAWRCLCALKRS
jgi:hypothetical protein